MEREINNINVFLALILGIAILAYVIVTIFGSLQNSSIVSDLTYMTSVSNESINVSGTSIMNANGNQKGASCSWGSCYTNCYQESFNESNQTGIDGECGLDYSGIAEYWWIGGGDNSLMFDGNWTTYTPSNFAMPDNGLDMYVQYVKPKNVIGAKLTYKGANPSGNITTIIDIPSNCLAGNSVYLEYYMIFNTSIPPPDLSESYIYCSATHWLVPGTIFYTILNYTSINTDEFINMTNFYEEAITWKVLVNSGNYSTNNCNITSITPTFNNTNWTCNYDYSYAVESPYKTRSNTVLGNTSTGITTFFGSVSPVYAILGILVVILILVILVQVIQPFQAPQIGGQTEL